MTEYFKSYDKRAAVVYLNADERRRYRVEQRGGLFYDATGQPINTHRAMFVMDLNGHLYAAIGAGTLLRTEGGHHPAHHSSFVAGEAVLIAGVISFADGVLFYVSNVSGHYAPASHALDQFLLHMREQGVDISRVDYTYAVTLRTIRRGDPQHIANLSPEQLQQRLANPGDPCQSLLGFQLKQP